jgi:hypothetical protein
MEGGNWEEKEIEKRKGLRRGGYDRRMKNPRRV